ncbi:hypothetical protein [Pedobacter nyackensis]|uniref:Uncharacterized protein n=1 Tax=Pedobacter nyackensis TaxID=475255 RepID=A0A1W2AJ40_9SPHI|nr:hypothetical protein [Pedobacter nyackensis]SMC60634.1 hypothetical protein SAMN04488101_101653 [Pedobacter nyackensis]
MNTHFYKNLVIQIFNDPTYEYGSSDNKSNYSKIYSNCEEHYQPSSKHGVKIYCNEEEINDCIILGTGGGTGISSNSSLIDSDQLLICCADTVFCLKLPSLDLIWSIQADQATCFQIHKLQDDFIIHGEILVTRISKDGLIKWQFGGSDIFVSFDGDEAFKLNTDHIALTDFCNVKYKVDFNGKAIN